MTKKQLFLIVIIAFFVGAAGSLAFTRSIFPYQGTIPGWGWANKFATNAPITITRHEEVQLNEGVNVIDLIRQAGNITASIYTTSATAPVFLGNGLLMTSDGLIFTSVPVVGKQTQFSVVTNDGSKFLGSLKSQDIKTGLAILTIQATNLPTAQFDNAADLKTGQRVISIGRGNVKFEHMAVTGLVVQSLANELGPKQISSDVVVNADYFGGPIINLSGHAVGLVIDATRNIIAEDLQTALSKYLAK